MSYHMESTELEYPVFKSAVAYKLMYEHSIKLTFHHFNYVGPNVNIKHNIIIDPFNRYSGYADLQYRVDNVPRGK